jgi:hypothetical protein
LIENMPIRYLHAAMRACRDRPDQTCDGGGWEEAAGRFTEYVGKDPDMD